MPLQYIVSIFQEGQKVVKLEQEDISEENEMWKMAIILYVIGNSPSIGVVERFIAAQ